MFFSRRHALLNRGGKTILVKNLADPDGSQPFELDTGFTATAGRALTLYLDFTFTGGSSANLICAGLNPAAWVQHDGLKVYLCIDGDTDTTRVHFFEQTLNVALGDPTGRNRMVFRVDYQTGSRAVLDAWRNGAKVIDSAAASTLMLGPVKLSNAEGTSRFRGTYHEISLLPGTLRDEQLRALTIV